MAQIGSSFQTFSFLVEAFFSWLLGPQCQKPGVTCERDMGEGRKGKPCALAPFQLPHLKEELILSETHIQYIFPLKFSHFPLSPELMETPSAKT